MNKILIGITTLNGEKWIDYCLLSLSEQTYKKFDLLIIDNGSNDKTLETVNKFQGQLNILPILKNKINLGFAKTYNVIFNYNYDYILALNQDIILKKDYLEKIFLKINKNTNIGSICGKIMIWKYQSGGALTEQLRSDKIDCAGLIIKNNFQVSERGRQEADIGQYDQSKGVFGLSAAATMYNKKALADVSVNKQFFDEDFFSYKEDVDLSLRLLKKGWVNYYCHSAAAFHDRSVKSQFSENDYGIIKNRQTKPSYINYLSYRNHLYIIIKNINIIRKSGLTAHIAWYEIKKIIYLIFCERKTLKAWKDAYQKYRFSKKAGHLKQESESNHEFNLNKWISA